MRIPPCHTLPRDHWPYPVIAFSGTLAFGRVQTSLTHPSHAAERASERLTHFFVHHRAPAPATGLTR